MSVILFSKNEVYQQLADAYEGLRYLRYEANEKDDYDFYRSLRRLYFANVATYLCQYHGDTPLESDELNAIDSFQELVGESRGRTDIENLNDFLGAWGSLRYNLTTNDGEQFRAQDAYDCINELAIFFSRSVAAKLTKED